MLSKGHTFRGRSLATFQAALTVLALAVLLVLPFTHAAPAFAADIVTYFHLDALGSPVAATDQQGNVVWREDYEPYGNRTRNEAAAQGNTQWYTGHPHDSSIGLTYMGARWYDPTLGRFMAVDPKGFTEGNPHSINRYAYANNNPYKYIDPDGQDAISIGVSTNLFKIPFLGFPLEGLLGGGVGFTISMPGATGGEFDVGVYRKGFGGYGFSPETSIRGIGKLVGDITASKGSVVDMEGGSTEHSFTVGPGGLHAGRKHGEVDSVGLHVGGGLEISSSGAQTEVYSARRGIRGAAEAAIDAGSRFISRTVEKKVDDLFGTPRIE